MSRQFAFCALLLAVTTAAAAAPEPAPPLRGYPDDLATGPFDAELSTVLDPNAPAERNGRRKVTVRYLTRQRVAVTEKGRVQVYDAKQVNWVDAGGKQVWQPDPATGLLTGPVLPRPAIDTSSRPATAPQLAVYLVLRAERLHRGLDRAVDRRDPAAAADLTEDAARFRDAAAKADLPDSVIELYRLDGYAKDQLAHLDRQQKAVATLREIKLTADQRVAAAAQEGVAFATLRLLAGGDELDLLDEALLFQKRSEVIARQATALSAEQRQAFKEAVDARAAGRAGLVRRLESAAAEVRLDPGAFTRLDELARQFASARDHEAAAGLLTKRAGLAAGVGGRRFPLLVCEIARLKARALEAEANAAPSARAARADGLVALARTVEEAVRDVPPGDAFDGDRVEVLTAAAELVHRAVTAGHGPQSWSLCFDPRAEYGVRLADAALRYNVELDKGGEARAVRAWLLFQRGLYQEAAEAGAKVGEVRAGDPTTQYNLARVYGKLLSGKPPPQCKPAADYLARAIDAGLCDMKTAKADPDLIAARNTVQWTTLTKTNVEAVMEATSGKSGGEYRFNLWLHNKSRFALKDVDVLYDAMIQTAPGRRWEKHTRTPKIAYLPPGESYLMTDLPEGSAVKIDVPVKLKGGNLTDYTTVDLPVRRGQVEYVPYWLRSSSLFDTPGRSAPAVPSPPE